jgi:iron complex transport system ATP-binding protein
VVAAGRLADTLTSETVSETFDVPVTVADTAGRWFARIEH